jgi:iron complex transport system ATP-binding protein
MYTPMGSSPDPVATSTPLLDFRHVTVLNGGKRGIHDVTLRITAGEHVAILGPNGSGKSTLIKTITRELYPLPTANHVCQLFGEDAWEVKELRKRLGIVSNDLQAWCARDITGFDLVLSGFFSSIGLWPAFVVTTDMVARARAVLEQLDAPHLGDRVLTEMSSGEARRLLIGRALVHDPVGLILDEPANSLDFRAAHEFREAVRRLARSGRTIVMVTHAIADVIPEIDRVVLLKEGGVVRDGPKGDVLTSASLSELFGLPLRVGESDGYFHIW